MSPENPKTDPQDLSGLMAQSPEQMRARFEREAPSMMNQPAFGQAGLQNCWPQSDTFIRQGDIGAEDELVSEAVALVMKVCAVIFGTAVLVLLGLAALTVRGCVS